MGNNYLRSFLSFLCPSQAVFRVPFLENDRVGIPRDSDITMPNNVSHAVVGHYLTFQILVQLDHTSRLYRIPKKTDWGIDPATCVHWFRFDEIQTSLAKSMDEKRSMLVWEKAGNEYSTFFVVWW